LSSDPRDFKVIGTDLVFFADNGSIGTELYKLSLPNAPTISAIANQTTPEDVPIANIPITINSAVSPLANLTLSGSSSNTSLISSSGFVFGGSGSNRTLTLTPNTFQNGSAIITITVCDNSNNCVSTNFNLTVTDVPNAPVLTDFAVTFNEDNIYSFTLGQFQA